LLRKIYLNCRSSKHCKKASFFKICTFLQLCICQLETELNLDPDLNPDPELVSDPAGSGCTTLVPINLLVSANIGNDSQCFKGTLSQVRFFFLHQKHAPGPLIPILYNFRIYIRIKQDISIGRSFRVPSEYAERIFFFN
jgi:hypothetical protein